MILYAAVCGLWIPINMWMMPWHSLKIGQVGSPQARPCNTSISAPMGNHCHAAGVPVQHEAMGVQGDREIRAGPAGQGGAHVGTGQPRSQLQLREGQGPRLREALQGYNPFITCHDLWPLVSLRSRCCCLNACCRQTPAVFVQAGARLWMRTLRWPTWGSGPRARTTPQTALTLAGSTTHRRCLLRYSPRLCLERHPLPAPGRHSRCAADGTHLLVCSKHLSLALRIPKSKRLQRCAAS